tara:strand:- start:45 stop:776 length:732 start_codon:yes stop_codon:yes gene_type:complete
MSISKYITRRDPQKIGEIRDMGINLNDFEGPIDTSTLGGLIKKAMTPVQPTGIRSLPFDRDFSMFDQAKMGQIPVSQTSSFRSLNDPEVYGELENKGIMSQFNPLNLLGFLTNIYTGGLSDALTTSGATKLFSNLLEAGKNTPNYQFVNPNKPNFNRIASDFYDPRTGLDRFDRAKTLFGQSRTLAEFLDKRREQKIKELDLAEKRRLSSRIPSGDDSDAGYSPGQDAGMGFGGGRTDPTDKS